MAKRFTDTEKWSKGLIRSLDAPYKLLWLYICDQCNHAGIWEVEIDVAAIRIGMRLDKQEAIQAFGEKIHVFDKGSKWFIPSFIDFQYGELRESNRVHNSVIVSLRKYHLLKLLAKGLEHPLQGGKDKDKDKDKDKEGESEGGREKLGPMVKAYIDMVDKVYGIEVPKIDMVTNAMGELRAAGITHKRLQKVFERHDVIKAHFRPIEQPKKLVAEFVALEQTIKKEKEADDNWDYPA